jgi:hypothetical protein
VAAPLGQVLPLGDQTLVNRAGQQGDAVLSDLVAEVLTGDANGTGAGRAQNAPLQVVPLLGRGGDTGCGHRFEASTPVLLALVHGVKCLGGHSGDSALANSWHHGWCWSK